MHKTILAPHNKYRRTYTRTPHSLSDSCVSTLHCAAQLSVCVCVSVCVLYKIKNSLFLALSSRCQCNNVGISFRLFSDSRMPQYHRISTYDIVCAYLCEPHHATHKVKAATRQRPVRERKKFIKLVSCYAVLARFSIQVERNKRNGVFWERWTFLHRFPTIKKIICPIRINRQSNESVILIISLYNSIECVCARNQDKTKKQKSLNSIKSNLCRWSVHQLLVDSKKSN